MQRDKIQDFKNRLDKIEKELSEDREYKLTEDLKILENIEYGKNERGEIYQIKANLALIYKDKKLDLSSLLPEGVIFYRREAASTSSFGYYSAYPHPLIKESEIKVILYSDLSNFIRLFALFHEIGHVLDFSKHGEDYKQQPREIIDLEKERRANAEALLIIRRLKREGYLQEELFSNETLFELVAAQLFRKK